jgi:hypothetical protein
MDKAEARRVLADEVRRLRELSYEEFRARIEEPEVETREVAAKSGTTYQLENQPVWDGEAGGDIRVLVAVDDGGLSAFKPLTDDFILAPDGSFVGE